MNVHKLSIVSQTQQTNNSSVSTTTQLCWTSSSEINYIQNFMSSIQKLVNNSKIAWIRAQLQLSTQDQGQRQAVKVIHGEIKTSQNRLGRGKM